ncbi:ATPase involved in chromosome partitioning [Methanolobus tindarius DSM 2278]|uniref:ATPase involved in chromosome partitioning n=1 Tax=Methanolobus tindarius DSM 2278 TaxID=1090322 RepID=W9DN47_METTI|nr:AAA family ATPase [Methanolobus tindarius]ETA67394.1 ATPase involved in chromosome partitioning [Methanolobus tindarius DSM 2278]
MVRNGNKSKKLSTKRLKKLPDYNLGKSKVIAIMNNKGGCGKTTTAISLGLHLARSGKNVLFWDSDPQSNLTQRLGLSDEKFLDSRLDVFFKNAFDERAEEIRSDLGVVVKYPYFYRLPDSDSTPGTIGIMPGSHMSEIKANHAKEDFQKEGGSFLNRNRKTLFGYFHSALQFYGQYFDYIIMDTAPAMEGNILCQLAVRSADEIICPIDGVEAASGIRHLLEWTADELSHDTTLSSVGKPEPNFLFAMVKYQADTKNVSDEENDAYMKNAVYVALKKSLGEFVCDNGIKESSALRNKVYGGFGKKTQYDDLCQELIRKMSSPRPNIFKTVNLETMVELDKALNNICVKNLNKKPEFKVPEYVGARVA